MGLITDEEKKRLQEAVGSQQTVVASGLARLHLASPDPRALKKSDPNSVLRTFRNLSEEEWTNTNVQGALAFVIDRNTDSFIFQIYDLMTFELRFEYELYYDMEYALLSGQFHGFEMEDCVAGFCFADATEAKSFITKVMALKPSTKQTGGNLLKPQKAGKEKKGGFFGGLFGGRKKKADSFDDIKIGEIKMVQHNQHVGVNKDGTFDLQNLPAHWKSLFKEAGIKKKDLMNPETAGIIMQTIQQAGAQQELAEMYKNDEEYADLNEDEIEEAVGEFSEEEIAAYQKYQEELRQYYEDLAAYEAEQAALEAWENEQAQQVEEERKRREEQARKEAERKEKEKIAPPPLPPRKLQEAAKQLDAEVKEAQKNLAEAEKNYRASVRRVEKSPAQLELEREREEARRAAEEARRLAEEAAAERDAILKELDAIKAQKSNKKKSTRFSLRRGKPKEEEEFDNLPPPPPLPALPPPILETAPPPPPPPPLPALPAPPQMPELPKLPRPSEEQLNKVKLAKAPKPPQRPHQNTLMGAIKGGVQLKKTESPKKPSPRTPSKALPDLKAMKPKAQNQLMANLIAKMQERRTQLGDESDDDDDWD